MYMISATEFLTNLYKMKKITRTKMVRTILSDYVDLLDNSFLTELYIRCYFL